ncbi:hypothetical protein, partial [Methylobacterium sp.]|uniref:hypothetical protein n=1 Tax=Methylobacterium sp. TaxID=409 RepID=UPI0025DF469D
MILFIIGYFLPLSASNALDRPPRGAHELGFWLLFVLSLPFWLTGFWLTTLSTVANRQGHRVFRRTIWFLARLIHRASAYAAFWADGARDRASV